MFPIPWNFPFRKKNGDLSTIGDEINSGGGGGSDLPPHSASDAGKLLGVKLDGSLEWSDEVNSEIQTLTKYANVQTNPNLLDNPWFTVNQRDTTSLTTGERYCVDRWQFQNISTEGSISVDSDGLLANLKNNDGLKQLTEALIPDGIYTLSIKINGVIYSRTFNISNGTTTVGKYDESLPYSCAVTKSGSHSIVYPIVIYGETLIENIRISAVKLELGEVSTLANDTAPNYATELTKCQRYYQCYKLKTNYAQLDNGRFNNDHEILMPLSLPTALRGAPTVNITNLSSLSVYSNNNDTISSITLGTSIYNSDDVVKVCLVVTTAGTNHTKGDTALIAGTGDVATAQPVIALSADL